MAVPHALLLLALAPPPLADIHAGKALDDLVSRLAGMAPPVSPEPGPRLPPKALAAINLTRAGLAGGGVKAFRDPAKLDWPPSLQAAEVQPESRHWVAAARRAALEARRGVASPAALRDLAAAHGKLVTRLQGSSDDLPITGYIEARRFLNHLRASAAALGRADAGELLTLTDRLASSRLSVPELVKLFRDKKLRFAPCLPGDGAGYVALHEALAAHAARAGK